MSSDPKAPADAKKSESTLISPDWLERVRELRLTPFIEKWRTRIRTHPATGLPLAPLRDGREDPLSIERLAFRAGKGLRIALKLFFPFCAILFGASFLFENAVLERILRSCSIAGIIGFGTNWIAIKMLFRPRQIRPIFGQGLIPSQRDEIIRKVADEVIDKLINEHIIRQELEDSRLISRLTRETVNELRRLVRDPEFIDDTKKLILTYAAQFSQNEGFRDELVSEVQQRVERVAGPSFARTVVGRLRGLWREPMVRVVNKELDNLPLTLDRLVGEIDEGLGHVPAFFEERQESIDAALTRIVMALIREIDVRHVVLKQLSTVTSDQLEVGFREFADDKLAYITLLGGLLGLVGGFVIIWPLASVAVLVTLLATLALLDVVVYWLLRGNREPDDPAAPVSPHAAPETPDSDSEPIPDGGTSDATP